LQEQLASTTRESDNMPLRRKKVCMIGARIAGMAVARELDDWISCINVGLLHY
jgi:hypothetical protein